LLRTLLCDSTEYLGFRITVAVAVDEATVPARPAFAAIFWSGKFSVEK
jgi:hypothetical protein